MENTLRVIGAEAGTAGLGSDLIALKMSEIIFAQVLRTHLESVGSDRPVLAGFADSNIARGSRPIRWCNSAGQVRRNVVRTVSQRLGPPVLMHHHG